MAPEVARWVVLGWERWLLVEARLEVLLRRGFVLERRLEWLVVLGSLEGVPVAFLRLAGE